MNMEHDSLLKSQEDPKTCILTSQTSMFMLNNDGLKLLQDTTEAVRVAIHKINVFKQYLKEQTEANTYSKPDLNVSKEITYEENEKSTTDIINSNQCNILPVNSSVQNIMDVNLQVFFTIPDNKINELEVREAFEKLGFEDFVITIKNRISHSFGFIKFSNEDSVTRAVEQNLKISLNGQLIKIRPHKTANRNSILSVSHTEEANRFSQEIDEGLLINVSSGYQNRRILNGYLESKNDQIEENEEESASIEMNNSISNSTEAETSKINSFIDVAKENIRELTSPQRLEFVESFSNNISIRSLLESNQNYNHTTSQNTNFDKYLEKNKFNKFKVKNKEKKFSPYSNSKNIRKRDIKTNFKNISLNGYRK